MLPKPAFLWIAILASGILVLTFWRVEFAFALLGVVLAAWTAYHAKVSHFLECFSRCNKAYADVNGRLRKPAPEEEQDRKQPEFDPDPDDASLPENNSTAVDLEVFDRNDL